MRLRILTAACGVALIVAAGCSSSGGTNTSAPPPNASKPTPTTVGLLPPVVNEAATQATVVPGSATGTSPCEKAAPTPVSPGQVGAGGGGSAQTNSPASVEAAEHGVRGKVQQFALTPAQQAALDAQMSAADKVVKEYPTVKSAEAAGYSMSTVYVPCIGAHYTNFRLTDTFDPAHPSELLYDGTQPDAKIVGLSYLVWHPGGAPPGFAGPNDHWHQHNANGGLCIKGGVVVAGEESTRAQCAALGGRKTLLTDVWMVHAWVVPGVSCAWGVFSGECTGLGGKIGGSVDPFSPTKS